MFSGTDNWRKHPLTKDSEKGKGEGKGVEPSSSSPIGEEVFVWVILGVAGIVAFAEFLSARKLLGAAVFLAFAADVSV